MPQSSDDEGKADLMRMLQQATTNPLETNERRGDSIEDIEGTIQTKWKS